MAGARDRPGAEAAPDLSIRAFRDCFQADCNTPDEGFTPMFDWMLGASMAFPRILAALMAASSGVSAKSEVFLTTSEIIKRMEHSQVSYQIKDLSSFKDGRVEHLVDLLYAPSVAPVAFPQVEVVDGERRVVRAPCGPAEGKLKAAEELFKDKKYEAASAVYDQAIALAPKCYVSRAYRGDADFFRGDHARALSHYEAALALNPNDGAIFLFEANALMRLGRLGGAADALRWSLALRPHNEIVLKVAKDSKALKLKIRDVTFTPRAFARKEGTGITIYWHPPQPEWLAYATCRGFWLGERRREVDGPGALFSLREERECIGALLGAYGGCSSLIPSRRKSGPMVRP